MRSDERSSTGSLRPRKLRDGWTWSDADRVITALLLMIGVYSTSALAELLADPWRDRLVPVTVTLSVLAWTWLLLLTGRVLVRATSIGITSVADRLEERKGTRPLAFSQPWTTDQRLRDNESAFALCLQYPPGHQRPSDVECHLRFRHSESWSDRPHIFEDGFATVFPIAFPNLGEGPLGRVIVKWVAEGRTVARAKMKVVLTPDGFLECRELLGQRVFAGLVGWASRVDSRRDHI